MRIWLREIRESNALTVEEMANVLGIEADYYEVMESGRLPLNIPVLLAARIAEAFEIPLSRLVLCEEAYKEELLPV